mmetsp:Transcript_16522/g.36175  ORF Transcript_16522/g.36175 Transcript_16522/m.36175 type:complete len:264 (+) Transcript_16522:164-955(+)
MSSPSRCASSLILASLFWAAQPFVVHDGNQAHSLMTPALPTKYRPSCIISSTRLMVVADYEEKEQQKYHVPNNNNNNHHHHQPPNNADAAWIPTESGGFLPNLNRHILFRRPTSANTSTAKMAESVTPPSKVIQIDGTDEYRKHVVEEKDRLICVRFHAPWCRACKAVAPAFRKMAKVYSSSVKFVEVPMTNNNAYLHQGLGIPSLPFVHLYHPELGLVEQQKIGKKKFPLFRQTLLHYVKGSCDLLEQDGEEEKGEESTTRA